MHPSIAERRDELSALCRRYEAARLDVFGSGGRGADFDPALSDVDVLVRRGAEPAVEGGRRPRGPRAGSAADG